jgi:hypothetical protein
LAEPGKVASLGELAELPKLRPCLPSESQPRPPLLWPLPVTAPKPPIVSSAWAPQDYSAATDSCYSVEHVPHRHISCELQGCRWGRVRVTLRHSPGPDPRDSVMLTGQVKEGRNRVASSGVCLAPGCAGLWVSALCKTPWPSWLSGMGTLESWVCWLLLWQ